MHPIGSHIPIAGFRILGDDVGGCEKRSGIFSYSPNRDRQFEKINPVAMPDVVFARAASDNPWRNRMFQGVLPLLIDAFDRVGFQTDRIDFFRGAEHSGGDRN